jgi:short-subunit dehydrogenase
MDNSRVSPWRILPGVLVLFSALVLAGCATAPSQRELGAIAGKTYVITGASSGLGRGVAERLGSLGANVVLASRRTDALNTVAERITAAGGTALVVQTDVADAGQVEHLAQAALARFGRIDVWINNAGIGAIGRFEEIPLADHARIVDVNLKGVIHGSHIALRQFRIQGSGTLVNLGSIEAVIPLAYHASYAATKAAIVGLGRALNEELRLAGRTNIHVATIMPWATDTPFFAQASNYSGHRPRMPAMDDPMKVVDIIVDATINPRKEVLTGWKAQGAYWSHRLAPHLTDRVAADIAHQAQFENSPPTPLSSGSVHQPQPGPLGVDGGVRERMRQEDAARAVAD